MKQIVNNDVSEDSLIERYYKYAPPSFTVYEGPTLGLGLGLELALMLGLPVFFSQVKHFKY